MKKILSIILICCFILPFNLVGCSGIQKQYALDSAAIALELPNITQQYAVVESKLRLLQTENKTFTDAEWESLQNVDATIDLLVLRFEAISKFDLATASASDVKFLFDMAKSAYTEGRGVMQNHWDEFAPDVKTVLTSFDNKAQMIDGQITKLLDNPNNININEAVTLITNLLSVVVKVIGVAAL